MSIDRLSTKYHVNNKGDSIGVSNIEDDFIEEYKVIDLFFVLCSQNKNLEDIQIVVSKK